MPKISRLSLEHFRLYDRVSTPVSPNINILVGDNAQGKTSFIEAIYVLGLTRSHKSTVDATMVAEGAPFARIRAQIDLNGKNRDLEVILSKEGKKAIYNRTEYKRLSDFIGILSVVMFAPEDLIMVKGSPGERRRFIDLELSQLRRHYIHHLSQYRRLLKERNEHLKALQKRKSDDKTLLEVLTDQLIHYANKIMERRREFITELNRRVRPIYEQLSGEPNLTIAYEPSITGDIAKQFRQKTALDIMSGTTMVGPHRDDCGFYFEKNEAKKIASQGQIRTIALSVKLAVIDMIEEAKGIPPVILLDDVFSELDQKRQKNILNHLNKKAQVFLTTTSLAHVDLDVLEDYKIFRINAGKIEGVDTHGPNL